MQLVFARESLPSFVVKSLFLAGPSPRGATGKHWRHEALDILAAMNYDGVVFIPIPRAWFYGQTVDEGTRTYDNQIDWECDARRVADVEMFWVPRIIDLDDEDLGMPGFTTNIEFGEDLHSERIVYGRPDNAWKCRYFDKRFADEGKPVYRTLEETLLAAVKFVGDGASRADGETKVPLIIWNTPQFQLWYSALKAAGNRLDDARVTALVTVGNGFLFSYILWVNVWVAAEQRHKSNEFVYARRDISVVIPYHKNSETGKIQVVLVREFRSTVRNEQGFVFELPGGSSVKPGLNPRQVAADELHEETGLAISDLDRFKWVGERQLMATVSSHTAHVYSIELTDDELAAVMLQQSTGKANGMDTDSERTYVEVVSVSDLFKVPVDYSMLGIIFETLSGILNPMVA